MEQRVSEYLMEWTIHILLRESLEEKLLPDYQQAVLERTECMGFHSLVAARN